MVPGGRASMLSDPWKDMGRDVHPVDEGSRLFRLHVLLLLRTQYVYSVLSTLIIEYTVRSVKAEGRSTDLGSTGARLPEAAL